MTDTEHWHRFAEDQARSFARSMTSVELIYESDRLTELLAWPYLDDPESQAICDIANKRHLNAVETELRRRSKVVTPEAQQRNHDLSILKDAIIERIDLADFMEWEGFKVRRHKSAKSANSSCPFCRDGDDRFIIWPIIGSSRSHGHCRQCGTNADVIRVAEELWHESFVSTVKRLATEHLHIYMEVA